MLEGSPERVASLQIDSQAAVLQLHSHWPITPAHAIKAQSHHQPFTRLVHIAVYPHLFETASARRGYRVLLLFHGFMVSNDDLLLLLI